MYTVIFVDPFASWLCSFPEHVLVCLSMCLHYMQIHTFVSLLLVVWTCPTLMSPEVFAVFAVLSPKGG